MNYENQIRDCFRDGYFERVALIGGRADKEIEKLKTALLLVAKLSAPDPMFYSPITTKVAESIRDNILEGGREIDPDKIEECEHPRSTLKFDAIGTKYCTKCREYLV